MQAILLAAGYGTRLQPYSLFRPKPLFPVLNRPLLFRLLDCLPCAAPLVVNCHHLAGQIQTALADRPEALLQYEPEILGTGGGPRRALEHLDDAPVLIMNGDLWHEIDLEALYAAHRRSGMAATLALHDYPRFNKVSVQAGRVRTFKAEEGELLAFTGIHVVEPEALRLIPPGGFYSIIDLYEHLAARGQVGFVRVDGARWRDIGTPEDYLALHGELLARPGGSWLIDPRAQLGENVILEDWGCIGAGAVIGPGTRLQRCVVWDGARLPTGSVRADAIIA